MRPVSFISKCILCLLGLLCLPLRRNTTGYEDYSSLEFLQGDMSVVIMLDTDLFSSQSRDIGFNYDLLDIFGERCNLKAQIDTRRTSDGCWRELVSGHYQLMAFDVRDTIPEEFKDKVEVSIPLRDNLAWAVGRKNEHLMNYVNVFFDDIRADGTYRDLVYRHYRSYRIDSFMENELQANALSPYDDVIRKYGSFTGIDWRLLSAIVYQESRYNIATVSVHNAMGLMQVKESTAAHYGVDNVHDPELNVKAGTLHFSYLINLFDGPEMDPEDVIKFALAAYNAGEGRIAQCRRVADSLGLNRNKWSDVSAAMETMESFGGRHQTMTYVDKVLAKYDEYRSIIE